MYNAGMWLVVKPTVGLPLFFGAVAVGSFAVHVAILTNTTWLPQFLNGEEMTSSASAEAPAAASSSVATLPATDLDAIAAGEGAVLVLPDGRTARVVIEPGKAAGAPPSALALAAPTAE